MCVLQCLNKIQSSSACGIVHKYILHNTNIPHDVWIVENIFMNNYTLDPCTHHCITCSVTAHSDNSQARPKHVDATN
jgi:NDP-sugar pyrophosphorylase family protein